MNKNIPHAVKAIREVLQEAGVADADTAATRTAHILDKAGLLVRIDRPRSGLVMRRKPTGGWTQQAGEALDPVPDPQLTDLEQQALAWDQACQRAQAVATGIHQMISEHPEFQSVQVDGDRVLVSLHITDQSRWPAWRAHFGITQEGEQTLPYVVGGDGYRDGVRVTVLAYDLPEARARALKSAKRPFQLDGTVYDLALPQRDRDGDLWYFQGESAEDGMPLLSMDGRPERCRLANVLGHVGPLVAVRTATSAGAPEGGDA
ncbi:BN159_2729 family protein [Streptomyces griseoincarnatus]